MLCSGGQALPGEHIEGTRTTTEERSERRLPPHDGTVRSMRRPPAPRAEGDEEPCEEPCARAGRPATECVGLCALLLIKVQVSAHGARPGRLHCGPVGTCTTTSNIAPGIMVHQNKMGTWQDLQWKVLWVPATGKLSELLGSLRPAAAAPHHDAAVAHCQACSVHVAPCLPARLPAPHIAPHCPALCQAATQPRCALRATRRGPGGHCSESAICRSGLQCKLHRGSIQVARYRGHRASSWNGPRLHVPARALHVWGPRPVTVPQHS
jgi:hypothetical protein